MGWTITALSAFADEAGGSSDAQIEALVRAGLTEIDLRSIDGHNICDLPIEKAETVRGKLDAAGIQVCMFGSPIGKIDIADDFQPDLDRLEHLGHLKHVFGAPAVRIFSYYNARNAPYDQWRRASLDRLQRLRDRAGQLGLVLYHENERHIFGDCCPEIEILAENVRDGNAFRLIFDFDNYNQSGDDVWENWRRLQNCTDAFHLKDSDTENRHVPVGQGNGRVREILADAYGRGWSGPMIVEPHLARSEAVAATGAHGTVHESFASMTEADSFHVAVEEAKRMIADIESRT